MNRATETAKAIRKELKAKKIKASVRKASYTSVRITLTDPKPHEVKFAQSLEEKYQEGHFNGMEDIYERSNVNADIPQVKFLFVDVEYSEELQQKALNWYQKEVDEEAPTDLRQVESRYMDTIGFFKKEADTGEAIYVNQLPRKILNCGDFWAA